MAGWILRNERRPEALVIAYAKLHELEIDFSRRPAQVYSRLVREKVRVGVMDLRIASIAIAADDVLLTQNLTDFRRVPGLRVEDWTT